MRQWTSPTFVETSNDLVPPDCPETLLLLDRLEQLDDEEQVHQSDVGDQVVSMSGQPSALVGAARGCALPEFLEENKDLDAGSRVKIT